MKQDISSTKSNEESRKKHKKDKKLKKKKKLKKETNEEKIQSDANDLVSSMSTPDKEEVESDIYRNSDDIISENNYPDVETEQGDDSYNDDDQRKIFVTRIPSTFNEESIKRIFFKVFGDECIHDVSFVMQRDDFKNRDDQHDETTKDTATQNEEMQKVDQPEHRGFAFVTMSSKMKRDEAISKGTIRGSAKEASKRKHTMYIRPIIRNESYNNDYNTFDDKRSTEEPQDVRNICYLWTKFRCPYADACKFNHDGEGGCVIKEARNSDNTKSEKLKKQKCFSYRTKGKCKLGDKCPYSHDFDVSKVKGNDDDGSNVLKENNSELAKKEDKDKDCISWKSKGKCRKGDECPYRHDPDLLEKYLNKKRTRVEGNESTKDSKKSKKNADAPHAKKVSQPLCVRVFGLNYATTKDDVHSFFEHCGTIREIQFPTFEDSGRSKGYCGVFFTSPKATEKACELDGHELHGRWLSVQSGKMYLQEWEQREANRIK